MQLSALYSNGVKIPESGRKCVSFGGIAHYPKKYLALAQVAWNVRANRGRQFQVGLFHGDNTGHVMLYCNKKVVQIDFSVQDTKSYSLMLDDELCEISITKASDGSYSYECKLDRETETPLNKARRQEKEAAIKDERNRLMVGVGVIILAVLGFIFFR